MNTNEIIDVVNIDGHWSVGDWWGALEVRCRYGRDFYKVAPGLYRLGKPGPASPVLVTANYKLTFDHLRRDIAALDAWILVLDTDGVNVWCAAGKGTFGTDELVHRINAVALAERVNHRQVILPQLGAPGIAAHEVTRRTGFAVVYGPVRSRDIGAFLHAGLKATPAMRRVTFDLTERLIVTPVEVVATLPHLLRLLAAVVVVAWLRGLPLTTLVRRYWCPSVGAVLAGTIGTPALLPVLPGRAFTVKGWVLGVVAAVATSARAGGGITTTLGHLLLQPVISAYLALNFTGSTPITSESGVRREIARYVTPMKVLAGIGTFLLAHGAIADLKRS